MSAVRSRTLIAGAATPLLVVAGLTGCAEKSKGDAKAGGPCRSPPTTTPARSRTNSFPAGHVKLDVENKGSKVTEVYVYAPGDRIVTERENIGPGTNAEHHRRGQGRFVRDRLQARHEGRRHPAEGRPSPARARRAKRDPRAGRGRRRVPHLRAGAGRRRRSRRRRSSPTRSRRATSRPRRRPTRPPGSAGSAPSRSPSRSVTSTRRSTCARTAWRRARSGPAGTGWRSRCGRTRRSPAPTRSLAGQLINDLKDWQKRVGKAEITPTSMANGAKELLDEVATGKVTGEEERYSHTDLVDFEANVEGAQKAYELLKPVAAENDPALAQGAGQAVRGAEHAARQVPRQERRLRLVRHGRQGRPQGAVGRGQRAGRAAVQARRRRRRSSRARQGIMTGRRHDRRGHHGRRRTADRHGPRPAACAARLGRCRAGARRRRGRRHGGRAAHRRRRRAGRRDRAAPRCRSTARTRRASPPPSRTGCTSPRSTSRPTTAPS